jgi:hypothetical protein
MEMQYQRNKIIILIVLRAYYTQVTNEKFFKEVVGFVAYEMMLYNAQ